MNMLARCVVLIVGLLGIAAAGLAQPAPKRDTFEDVVERVARPEVSAVIVEHFAQRSKAKWFGPRLRIAVAVDESLQTRNAACLKRIEVLFQSMGAVAGFNVPVTTYPLASVRKDASGALVFFADDVADMVLVISPRDSQPVDIDAPPATGGAPLSNHASGLANDLPIDPPPPLRYEQRYFSRNVIARTVLSVMPHAARAARARDALCAHKQDFFVAFAWSITAPPTIDLADLLYRHFDDVQPPERRVRAAYLLAILATYRDPDKASRTSATRFADYRHALVNTKQQFEAALDQ